MSSHKYFHTSLCLNCFHLLARKPNLENVSIYSIKFFHNFYLSVSSFTCLGLRTSGLHVARMSHRITKLSIAIIMITDIYIA